MSDSKEEICNRLATLYQQQIPFVTPVNADKASGSAPIAFAALDAWAKRREEIAQLKDLLYRILE